MMKKSLLTLICTLTFFLGVIAQVFRPVTSRYNNPSVKGNIVFVANNIVTTPAAITTEMPPGGTAFNNANPCVNIDIDTDVPAHTPKIPFGSVWNYHSNGAAPANNPAPTDWKQPAYTMTAAWNALGTAIPSTFILPPYPGKYGFSNPANATIATCIKSSGAVVACAPAAGNKYSTYYFRKTVNFTAPELAAFSTVLINMKRIDGIVVYINGVERIRDNMPAGVINYGTFARNDLGFAQENTVFYADPSYFNAGVNTIAVEVHTFALGATNMAFDMEMLGIDAASTFNSSSATLNLNSCSQVLFAGLYWGANHQQNANSDTSWIKQETKIKLKIPGAAAYQTVTSTQTDYHNGIRVAGLVHAGYASFADVTSLINTTNPNGVYTVGDLKAPIGWNSGGAGWTLVIAYTNPGEVQRNLTVFDGSAIAKIGVTLTIPITGFLTPPAPNPVSCELGVVAYDGDRALLDNFSFKQDANPLVGSYTNMTPNATSILNDMFNSTISTKGVLNPGRTPSHNNTLGFDADIIDVPNAGNLVLGNNQTSASVRLGSTAEDFMVQVLTTSISIYNPSFSFDKSATDLNGGAFLPGDSLLYKIKYSNFGNDSSVNTIILDNLPSGTAYVPGSIKIGTAGKTDAAADDQAEYDFTNNRVIFRLGVGATSAAGGRIGSGVIDSVQFKVVAASSCQIVSCVGSLRNNARINYGGKLSGNILFDSSGVNTAGCIIKGPVIHPMAGACFVPKDTVLINKCTTFTVRLPYAKYAGYTFYSAMPFIPANVYNQYTPVISSGIYWAYYTNGAGCSDTARIAVIITGCPDIDDDNDGIPDYVEFNNPAALADSSSPANGIPNWNDPTYPGYVNNNFDNVNDNFDYGADSDNDGIPNFYDTDFPGFVDTNGDGVNDNSDKDLDGIPNQYDLDSDNDGIPDTVESYGVETNGDGLIDSYTDTDADGFSQNVDANNTGVSGSGNGLGAQDFDTDGLPNYLDTDSDNDGIPDVVEVFGSYVSNSGKLSNFVDANSDGISDNNINVTALLITGPDGNSDGRADNWPNKNFDFDLRPNAYDIDSDADGIIDIIEAGLPDIAAPFGVVDGVIGTNGWSGTISGMPSLNLPNTDGAGNPNFLDIDSDDDGIPDNIEGLSTVGYKLPALLDSDGDGLVNIYETAGSIAIFGGAGNGFYDHDLDGIPDYRDLDTDADGQPDIIEGNDFNLNGLMDDIVSLTGLDSDGDGLDNRFDSLNNVLNIKGTSYRMGTGGTLTGDPAPGSRTTVQKKVPAQSDRDWRSVGVVLPVEFLKFSGSLQNTQVLVSWTIIALKDIDHFEIERSIDNTTYTKAGVVADDVKLNQEQSFVFADDITGLNGDIIYYRLKVIGKGGEIKYSNILVVRKTSLKTDVTIMPNPANNYININLYSGKNVQAQLIVIDKLGRKVLTQKRNLLKGDNKIYVALNNYAEGVYAVIIETSGERVVKQFIISR